MKKPFKILLLYLLCLVKTPTYSAVIIQDQSKQMGDNIMAYSLAKILSLEYDIPLNYVNFKHADLFMLSSLESAITPQQVLQKKKIYVKSDRDVINNKNNDVYLIVNIHSCIDTIKRESLDELKKFLELKTIPVINPLPKDVLTVAVHIRKGNGGGEVFDGEAESLQYFDYNRNNIRHIFGPFNYPFDPEMFHRFDISSKDIIPNFEKYVQDSTQTAIKTIANTPIARDIRRSRTAVSNDRLWSTRFLPNQFYVDYIRILSTYLQDAPFFVQIFTDDKDPHTLVQEIKEAVNKPNITFHYEDYRHLPFGKQMNRDLYMMSKCDILIRSESQFARAAELIGSHKLIIHPLECRWEADKLIPQRVVIKGSLQPHLTCKMD